MSLRFAPARSAARSPVARALRRREIVCIANDNGDTGDNDALLAAALRHFSVHGLSAARAARKEAETAFFAGDRAGYDWWLGVCRLLDKRLAAELEHSPGSKSA